MASRDFTVYGAKIEIAISDVKTILSALDKLQKTLNTISSAANAGYERVEQATRRAAGQTDHLTSQTEEYGDIAKAAFDNITNSAARTRMEFEELSKTEEGRSKAAKKLLDIQKQQNDFLIAINQSQAILRNTDFRQEVAGVQSVQNGYKNLANSITQVRTGNLSALDSIKTLAGGAQSFIGGISRVQEGLNIALADTSDQYNRIGKTALGLKTAFFGITGPSAQASKNMQFLAGVLDKVIQRNISLSKTTSEYGAKAAEVAEQAAQYNRGLGDSLLALNRAAKISGVDASSQLRRVAAAANEASNRFDEIRTTIEAGGKVNRALLSAQTKSVTQLRNAFTNLEVSGVIPTVEAIDKLEKELEQLTDQNSQEANQLRNQVKNLRQLRKQYLELKDSIEINNRATQLIGVNLDAALSKSRTALTKIRGFLFPVKKETDGVSDSTRKMGTAFLTAGSGADEFGKKIPVITKAMEQATQSFSVFRDVMLGTLAGGLLLRAFNPVFGLFNRLTSMISGFVAHLKSEFVSANNLVQNFEVTLKQMLTGFDEETVTKSLQGAQEFIRQIIAKTPFELATGQQAFQQLITGGLDPREWLEPAADAAAAFNKPMEQLIFAIQRLKAGSKGIGVDMIRDFGIPVQQVGVWINDSTGEVLEFNEVAGKTEEQLEASGNSFKRWGFDAQGSLEQAPAEAIEILNGYLKQNATIAGGAAARSRTLTGVLSNMQDSVTALLTAFGSPIWLAITDILASIYAVVERIVAVAEPFAKIIGEQVSESLYNLWEILTGIDASANSVQGWAEEIQTQFQQIADKILTYLKPALQVILALVQGDFPKAWSIFLKVAQRAIQGVGNFLRTTGRSAFQWGVQFVGMIAKGLLTAAKSALRTAVTFVSTMISRFLRPGSPPEEGPLSDIDTWGEGLMETFGEGFKLADLGFLQDTLAPIKDDLIKALGTEGFKDVRGNLIEIIKGINDTGEINEDLWTEVTDKIGAGNEVLKEYLGLQLQVKKANKKVQDASEAGFVSQELLDEAEALQIQLELKKEDLELSKRAAEQTQVSQVGGGALDDLGKETETGLDNIEEEIEQSIEEQLAEIKAGIDKEKEILKKKYDSGLISEEEYRNGLLQLQEQYVDAALQLGVPADAEIEKLKQMRAEFEAAFGDTRAETPLDKPADLLSSFAEGVTGEFEKVMDSLKDEFLGESGSTWQAVKDTFFSEFTPVWDEITTSINESLGNIFGTQDGQTFGLSDFFGYLLDNATQTINDKWFGPGGLKEFLTTKITELFDFLGSEEGPLAKLGNALNQIAISLQTWTNDPANQEKIRKLSETIGAVVFDGIKTGIELSFYGTEKTAPLVQNIANALLSIFRSINTVFTQLAAGLFGETFAAIFTAPLAIAIEGVWAIFNPIEAFQKIISDWQTNFDLLGQVVGRSLINIISNIKTLLSLDLTQAFNLILALINKAKEWFYDLYLYLVGASIIPDIVNGILSWIDKLDVGFISKIEDMYTKAVEIFDKLKMKITEVLNKASELGSSAIGGLSGLNPFSGLTGYAAGTMNVPETGPAILHKGEAVLQAPVAELLRQLLRSVGATSFGQSPGNNNSRNVNVNNPVFPNVKTGRDAKDFMRELDNITRLSELRGGV